MQISFQKNSPCHWYFSFGFNMGTAWLYIGPYNWFFKTRKAEEQMSAAAFAAATRLKTHPIQKCPQCLGHGYVRIVKGK